MSDEIKILGEVRATARGFAIIDFKDCYGAKCSLQESSLANYEKPGTSAVWLGVDDPKPEIMASDAKRLGLDLPGGEEIDGEVYGWLKYPIPKEVNLTTRMHLDRDQVAALILHLQGWLDNDTFEIKE